MFFVPDIKGSNERFHRIFMEGLFGRFDTKIVHSILASKY